jgi:hypothetical protein
MLAGCLPPRLDDHCHNPLIFCSSAPKKKQQDYHDKHTQPDPQQLPNGRASRNDINHVT